MAYRGAKRVKRRYRRKGYSRYRRRYRRRYTRRMRRLRSRTKRARGHEVKTAVGTGTYYWPFDNPSLNTGSSLLFFPMRVLLFGGVSTSFAKACVQIPIGISVSQRIGAQIRPIKFRLTGSISYMPPANFQIDSNGFIPNITPMAYHLRLIVGQLRGARGDVVNCFNGFYHQLVDAPYNSTDVYGDKSHGVYAGDMVARLVGTYAHTSNGDHNIFSADDLCMNMSAAVGPLRQGITKYMRILYNKCFRVDSGTHNTVPFRIKTKVPSKLKWVETRSGEENVDTQNQCSNPIVVYWILVPQSTQPTGRVYLHQQAELFYTDS